MSFGQQLQIARKKSGLTQKQLGDAIGLSKSTITSWETGARQPDIPMIKKLTQVLSVSAEYLLEIEKASVDAETIHIDGTIRKYAQLDEFGKRAVAAVTDIEFERCISSQNHPQLRAARGGRVTTEPLPDELTLDTDTSDLDG